MLCNFWSKLSEKRKKLRIYLILISQVICQASEQSSTVSLMSSLSVVAPSRLKYHAYPSSLMFNFNLLKHPFLMSSISFLIILQKLINEKCRKLSKRVAFYTVDCRDSCGEIFVDLQHHKYSKVKILFDFAHSFQYHCF